jgi:hypothetical protein
MAERLPRQRAGANNGGKTLMKCLNRAKTGQIAQSSPVYGPPAAVVDTSSTRTPPPGVRSARGRAHKRGYTRQLFVRWHHVRDRQSYRTCRVLSLQSLSKAVGKHGSSHDPCKDRGLSFTQRSRTGPVVCRAGSVQTAAIPIDVLFELRESSAGGFTEGRIHRDPCGSI